MDDAETLHEALSAIGYEGKLLQKDLLENTITSGPKSEDFRELVCWIANEIHILSQTEEKVNLNTEFSEFMLETSALLKELGCPYEQLIGGPLTDRFQTKESKFLLFDFLIAFLMATKMCIINNPEPEDTSNIIETVESRTAKALEMITKDLGLGKPPENISSKALFEKINKKLILTLDKMDKDALGEPLLKVSQPFTEEQWNELEKINRELEKEYSLRKEMLLTRLDVTVQSFMWSDKMKSKQDEIMKIYQQKLKEIDELSNDLESGSLAGLISARSNRAVIERVSNANVRKNTFSAKVQRHIIGKVPDRGGRAFEHDIPPPEMPSWQQNRSTGGAGSGGGGRGNQGGRGGRGGNSGNFNQGGGTNFSQGANSGGYNQGGGGRGYGQGGGNYNQVKNSGGFIQGGGGYSQGGRDNYQGNRDNYNQGGRDGNYSQGGIGGGNEGYNQNSSGQQNYGNSNRANYSQSRIQGRGGGSYGNERFNSGDDGNRRNDQGSFSRGRSNYNRGSSNRY